MSKEEKKNKWSGILGTIGFHLVLLLILILFRFSTPIPLPEEQGILINFGTSDEGTGEVQPEETPMTTSVPKPAKSSFKKVTTQSLEEAPKINAEEKSEERAIEKPKEPEKKADPNALYKGKSKTSQTAASEGETGKPGDQGSPNGDPNAKSHVGGGTGDKGLRFSLGNRKLLQRPSITDRSQETGTVVVQITVDKFGKVIKANPGVVGTNTSSNHLWNLAKQSAYTAKFNASPESAEEQKGTITFVFTLE